MRRPASLAGLGVAGLLSFPIFWIALMGATLAVERTSSIAWTRGDGRHVIVRKLPDSANEGKIWLIALGVALLMLVLGYLASYLRQAAVYAAAAAGIALVLGMWWRADHWAAGHIERWPEGQDLQPDLWTSNQFVRGQWEEVAVETIRGIGKGTIGLAIGCIVVQVVLQLRRRRDDEREAARQALPT